MEQRKPLERSGGSAAGVFRAASSKSILSSKFHRAGANEQIDLFSGTILGGKLQTLKNGLVLAVNGDNTISGTNVVSGSNIEVIGGTLTATNLTIGANT
jgi:hypothetical protein